MNFNSGCRASSGAKPLSLGVFVALAALSAWASKSLTVPAASLGQAGCWEPAPCWGGSAGPGAARSPCTASPAHRPRRKG